MLRNVFFFSIILIAFTCSGNQASPKGEKSMLISEIPEQGEEVYRKHCLVCHQTDGSGNPGMFPPLSETKTVSGDKEALIGIVLNGLQGEIVVKGETYNQVMAPYSFLADQEIADLLTFVRKSFGNNYSAVSPEEVAKMRIRK